MDESEETTTGSYRAGAGIGRELPTLHELSQWPIDRVRRLIDILIVDRESSGLTMLERSVYRALCVREAELLRAARPVTTPRRR